MNCEADIVWTTLHGNPLNCCGDISTLKITDVNLRVALQEEDHQRQQDPSPEYHEFLKKYGKPLRHFQLDQSGGSTNISTPLATPLVWLKML